MQHTDLATTSSCREFSGAICCDRQAAKPLPETKNRAAYGKVEHLSDMPVGVAPQCEWPSTYGRFTAETYVEDVCAARMEPKGSTASVPPQRPCRLTSLPCSPALLVSGGQMKGRSRPHQLPHTCTCHCGVGHAACYTMHLSVVASVISTDIIEAPSCTTFLQVARSVCLF
jgi:hypothetical protein